MSVASSSATASSSAGISSANEASSAASSRAASRSSRATVSLRWWPSPERARRNVCRPGVRRPDRCAVPDRRVGLEPLMFGDDVVDGGQAGAAHCRLTGIDGNKRNRFAQRFAQSRTAHPGRLPGRAPSLKLAGGCAFVPLAVALLEARDAAAGVEDLLLARVERVALRADFDGDPAARGGAPCLERVAATTRRWWRHSQGEYPSSFLWCPFDDGRRVTVVPRRCEPVPDSTLPLCHDRRP